MLRVQFVRGYDGLKSKSWQELVCARQKFT